MTSQYTNVPCNSIPDLEPSQAMSFRRTCCGLKAKLTRLSGILAISILLVLTPQTLYASARLVICYGSPFAALVPLAQLRDFYTAEGLDIELRNFSSGKQALAAMFAGECALATATEPPIVQRSLIRNDFRIIAAISESNDFDRIIVRSDRGILTPADLRGRRIAVSQFTSAHYFLDIYLAANGLAPQEVTKVYLPPQEVALAFRRGEVDAASHWEPNIQMMAGDFASKAKILTAPSLHIVAMMLVGERDFVRKNQAVVERILRALLRAERYAKKEAISTKALLASKYTMAQSEIDFVWPLYKLRLTLDQSLLLILENAARWSIGLMPPAQRPALPNYLDFIYLDGLKTVNPDAVTIIH